MGVIKLIGMGCKERQWTVHPWRCLKLDRTRPWTTKQGIELDGFLWSLPTYSLIPLNDKRNRLKQDLIEGHNIYFSCFGLSPASFKQIFSLS